MTKPEPNKALLIYLIITAIVCGALVMVIEVLGSRVIGPFFGVSLFVWTSLITVTLIALAAGYAFGGLLADRKESPDYLFGIILLGGILVLLIPFYKENILKLAMPLGLRGGSFISTLLLFGPSLFMLGCVSPYLVKVAARELKNLGRTVGGFYALSTFGSVGGTVITGFILIAYLGVDNIFLVVGSLLIVLSTGYFVFFRRKWLVAISLIIPFLAFPGNETVVTYRPDGTKVTEVASQESFYGSLKVVDYSYERKHIRELMIDGLIQGGMDMTNGMSISGYHYFLQLIPRALNPAGKNCLVIGVGAGLVPMWYEKLGVRTDVVDIDHRVVQLARKYFGFDVSGDVVESDARYFLINNDKRYDYIILDVFNGDLTPGHVISLEAFKLMENELAHGGILAINLIGSIKENTQMTASVLKTLHVVFDQVDVFPVFEVQNGEGVGNLAVMAYDGPKLQFNANTISISSIHPKLVDKILRSMQQPFQYPPDNSAIILTDNYNPIDVYDVWLRELVRKRILQLTDLEVLI